MSKIEMTSKTSHVPKNATVYLNVGGVFFATRASTLKQRETFFSGLLHSQPNSTEFFVDRDPTYFRYILTWLRGCRVLPEESNILDELAFEADYFGLNDMHEAIINTKVRNSVPRTLATIAQRLHQRG